MQKKHLTLLLSCILVAITGMICSCTKDESGPKDIILISDPDNDGYVSNSSPRQVNTTGASLMIGWTGGNSCRGFVSFDIASIKPSGDKSLVIEKAVLKLYQKNYNLLPFTGEYDDIARVAEVYLVDYGTLESADYSLQAIANCGVIASAEMPLHAEVSLNVTSFISNYLTAYPATGRLQFRIQLTNDANTENHLLDSACWYLFPGEEPDDEDYLKYRPALEIKYSYR